MSRLIDADELITDLKEYVENIKNIRDDGKCFLTEENVLSIIEEQPTFETDNYVEQLRWERDIAISQLERLGIGFGEKIEDEVIEKIKEVIRCD